MEGINLFYLALAAACGGIIAALMGAWDAIAKGEKWSWPKFGVSGLVAVVSGGTYAAIGTQAGGLNLWVGLLTGFVWGAGGDVLSNRAISLVLNKSTKTTGGT